MLDLFKLFIKARLQKRAHVRVCYWSLVARQVLDARVLPNYCYRDDGMLLYKAIDAYVTKIVRFYYGNSIITVILLLH